MSKQEKIKAKSEFVKKKNEYEKMEQDVVKSIVKNEKITMRNKEIGYEELTIQGPEEIEMEREKAKEDYNDMALKFC